MPHLEHRIPMFSEVLVFFPIKAIEDRQTDCH